LCSIVEGPCRSYTWMDDYGQGDHGKGDYMCPRGNCRWANGCVWLDKAFVHVSCGWLRAYTGVRGAHGGIQGVTIGVQEGTCGWPRGDNYRRGLKKCPGNYHRPLKCVINSAKGLLLLNTVNIQSLRSCMHGLGLL